MDTVKTPSSKSSKQIKSRTIMMVDNDLDYLIMMAKSFKSKGFNFVPVRDPLKISQHIKSSNPDIIIMEIALGQVRGDVVIRVLRKNMLKLPIILISKQIDKKIISGLKGTDISAFFTKPVSFHKLYEKIQAIFLSQETSSAKKQLSPSILIISDDKDQETDKKTEPVKDQEEDKSTDKNNNIKTFVPMEIIEKYKARIITSAHVQDTVEVLKKPLNNVIMVLMQADDEIKTLEMTKLFSIIKYKLKIPVLFISDKLSQNLKEKLIKLGFSNFISRSETSSKDVLEKFDSALSKKISGYSVDIHYKGKRIISELKAIKTLPPLPDIYFKIEKLSHDPNATAKDYGKILDFDPAITMRILRMSNSAFYSFKRKIKSVKDAVALMGTNEILSLVRMASIIGNLKTKPDVEVYVKKIWKHSATCAIAAKLICEKMKIYNQECIGEDLFICGLLHDIGKIVLWKFFPDDYMSFNLAPGLGAYTGPGDEEKILGTSHCEVGAQLAKYWLLPEMFNDIILYHHTPMRKPESKEVIVIYLANVLTKFIMGVLPEKDELDIDPKILEKIGYTKDKFLNFARELEPVISKQAELVSMMIVGH